MATTATTQVSAPLPQAGALPLFSRVDLFFIVPPGFELLLAAPSPGELTVTL